MTNLEKRGANVKVKDLVKMNFDPVMRPEDLKAAKTKEYTSEVKSEQADILWADVLVTISPVWFGNVPGFLKAYFDKLFVMGFGYDEKGNGLLQGKRIFSLFTMGSGDTYLELSNQYKGIEFLWDNLFGFVGFCDVALKYFRNIASSTDEERQNYLKEASEFTDQIFNVELGRIGKIGNGALLAKLQSQGYLSGRI
ncbi:NAD(P)H-dependent oxidoreductase [Dysgonomonas sp. BGC7]|nr:NAD(P)H-dependent oxidoreductase [Dysgonomonas sp. BGC7]